jgi:hypothetical protein
VDRTLITDRYHLEQVRRRDRFGGLIHEYQQVA